MSKRIEIKLIDPECNYNNDVLVEDIHPRLYEYECKNILEEAKKVNISTDELIDAIVADMYKRQVYLMTIDIDGREQYYGPAKEMTLSEIEAAIGHKVKIVNEQKEDE